MSDPCPPAFIRTAPPTEPGTPTAHSNPVTDAAAVRRASTGRATPPPAVTTTRPSESAGPTAMPFANSASDTAIPGNPESATSRFEPRPIASTCRPVAAFAAATRRRSSIDATSTNKRRPAADAVRGERRQRRVALGPGPSSRRPPDPRRPSRLRRRTRRRTRHRDAPSASGQHLVGQRGDVAAAHRDADVAVADLAGEERHQVVALGQPRDARRTGRASSTALTTSLPVTPGIGWVPDG